MRFLSLQRRRPSSAQKHQQLPVQIHSWCESTIEPSPVVDEDAELDALLRELDEDPFDVWARLCVPQSTPERESLGRVRRSAKPRVAVRRRAAVRG